MKKQLTTFLILIFAQQLSATSFYEQLCDFNYNWKKYENRAPKGEAHTFQSDSELVQAHLKAVIKILRTNPVAHLNNEQLILRSHLIKVLDDYRKAGLFPQNYYREDRIPVFIDQHNTHCAVGYLLQQTGYENVAKRIAAKNNYAWVKEINDAALPNWQKASGFTLEEIKLIQGAYDFYMPNAKYLINRYEVPQKPECMVLYFDDTKKDKSNPKDKKHIWCYGQGENGVLNGRWEQNYSKDLPWIVGHFKNGERTGQWKEYYQGTNQLCRTENWRNDKLNGVRKRFNRKGVLIEEIIFKNGMAISKTNHDLENALTWVRKPLDSNLVYTEVYTFLGGLIATGNERIDNPNNLLWFQNIELTALNSFSITSRDQAVPQTGESRLYGEPALVEYKKEGDWVFYQEFNKDTTLEKSGNSMGNMLANNYSHFKNILFGGIRLFDALEITEGFDSIGVVFEENYILDFYGYGGSDYLHLQIAYYKEGLDYNIIKSVFWQGQGYYYDNIVSRRIKELRKYNEAEERVGVWKYYDTNTSLYKTEHYILPRKEELVVGL